jgi:2-(1,2-epoxy-1,2-dihydrophenyl)acetyl-CoA isomerase
VSSDEAVVYDVEDGVATIMLNRPESLNALDDDIQDGLAAAVARADTDRGVGCVVVTGAGRGFCAGGNVKGMSVRDSREAEAEHVPGKELEVWEDAARAARRMHNRIVLPLYEHSKPTIALVNGPAAGAGVGLACVCDLRIAYDSAFFTTSFGRVGRSGDFGTTFFLRQLVGPSMARQLFFTAERVSADRALEIGLVNYVYPAEEAADRCQQLARQIASGPKRAHARMKQVFRAADAGDVRLALDLEASNMTLSGRSAEGREFLRSFLDKRQ